MDFGFGTFLSLANSGYQIYRGVKGARDARRQSSEQQNFYQNQKEQNKALAAFNSDVARRTGVQQANFIMEQTKSVVSTQMATFGTSGFDYDIGTSQEIVATASIAKGIQAAEQAIYNAEIESMQIQLQGDMAVNQSEQNRIAAGYSGRQARDMLRSSIFDAAMGGLSAFQAFKSDSGSAGSNTGGGHTFFPVLAAGAESAGKWSIR